MRGCEAPHPRVALPVSVEKRFVALLLQRLGGGNVAGSAHDQRNCAWRADGVSFSDASPSGTMVAEVKLDHLNFSLTHSEGKDGSVAKVVAGAGDELAPPKLLVVERSDHVDARCAPRW